MAKKKQKDDTTDTAKDETEDDNENKQKEREEEEEEMELLQVDLGDIVKLKQVLDEAVAQAILEVPDKQNNNNNNKTNKKPTSNKNEQSSSASQPLIQEDYVCDNYKLLIMTLACAFAMVAQFAPLPFPESRPILGLCGSLYFILSGLLQLITILYDQDAILITKPLTHAQTNNRDLQTYGIRVRTNLPRFSEYYTIILQFNGLKDKHECQQKSVQRTFSVGNFFDKEGYFDEVALMEQVETLFWEFEQANYHGGEGGGDSQQKKQQ